ncbi:MAG: nucleotide exchange factor GrpE [Planctomycetales bacterium]|nr:nucleotide exchange factor GrpE [Planctomycetales bacterium]
MSDDVKAELENESTDEAFLDQAVSDVPETRDEEMERLRHTAAEADKRVLQAQAEAENFRKRMRRDFEDQLKFASTELVIDMLEVRDNLSRAIEAAQSGEQGSGLQEGVAMVVKQMDDVFGKYGVVEIPAAGEVFDPNVHEAISQMPSDIESGKIAHVAVSGFKLHDRVVRPSQVVVSTGPAS